MRFAYCALRAVRRVEQSNLTFSCGYWEELARAHPSDGRGGCRACLAEIGQSALLNHPHGSIIAIGFYAGY
jgi:hypothetical protein